MANSAPSYPKALGKAGKVVKLVKHTGRMRNQTGGKSGAQVAGIKRRMGLYGR